MGPAVGRVGLGSAAEDRGNGLCKPHTPLVLVHGAVRRREDIVNRKIRHPRTLMQLALAFCYK
jgi:streptomycin 6-kinase